MSLRRRSSVGLGSAVRSGPRPTPAQKAYLRRGLEQPGGKLPLFDEDGQRYSPKTIRSCIAHGWAEPWFDNPIKPDWLVCKLTPSGRAIAEGDEPAAPGKENAPSGRRGD